MAICTPICNVEVTTQKYNDIITSGLHTCSIYCPGNKQNDGQLADSTLPHYNSGLGLELFKQKMLSHIGLSEETDIRIVCIYKDSVKKIKVRNKLRLAKLLKRLKCFSLILEQKDAHCVNDSWCIVLCSKSCLQLKLMLGR